MLRTHTCGELTKDTIGKTVSLTGWVHRVRDHGGVTFIHVRDRYGITQAIIDLTKGDKKIIDHVKSLGR
jgi:aspartyl-tRNA synthetase